jgi:hypothetical protein
MAWGKNFSSFKDILFDYFPLYNKFRVPSMTLVIIFLLMPLMSIFTLDYLLKHKEDEKAFIKKSLLRALYIVGGSFLLIALLGSALFDFSGANDERLAQNAQLLDLLIEDRGQIARSSAFRSFGFAAAVFILLYLYLNNNLKKSVVLLGVGLAVLIDLWSFDKQHLNNEDFVEERIYNSSYQATVADSEILKDDSYYRVFNLQNPFNDAMTSYHHHAVGGYHGAKLQRYQELYEEVMLAEQNRIVQNLQNNKGQGITEVFKNTPVLNMMNAKYIIYNPQATPIQNPQANGASWFVKNIQVKDSARAVIDAMKNFSSTNTAVVHQAFADGLSQQSYTGSGSIRLTNYDPKTMSYKSNSTAKQFAVFSEIYYRGEEGDWKAYIDEEEVPHVQVNYVLRGLEIPAGEHNVVFKFRPQSYYAGETISMTSSIILGLVFILAIALYIKQNPQVIKS